MQNINDRENGLIRLAKWLICRLSWKLIAQLAVVAMLGGCLYFAWEARWKIYTESASRWARPEIVEERLPTAISQMVAELNPKTIYVWAASVAGDTKRPIYVWVDGMRRPELEGRTEPLFPDNVEGTLQVVRLIKAEAYCADHNYMARNRPILRESGVVWGCAVSIPPEYGAIIGAITVGFTEKRADEFSAIRSSLVRWAQYLSGRTP